MSKSVTKKKTTCFISIFCLCSLFFSNTKTLALPEGYNSISGNVQFNQNANILNVSSGSNQSIVNYQSFNLSANEVVNFNLPNASSVILNRVIGGSASEIFGSINSNGKVFLVNPSGILFGSSAQINVGSLLASTLSIQDADFLGGKYTFTTSEGGRIQNGGSINIAQGGYNIFLGGAINNSGSINAPNGQVNFAVGNKITVNTDKGINVSVVIDEALKEKVEGIHSAIENLGSIKAQGGLVKFEAQLLESFYNKSVNNEGIIEATGFVNKSSGIELIGHSQDNLATVFNSGQLIASNTEGIGGSLLIIGDKTALIDNALLDVSGKTGGGEILIGGDYQGTPLSPSFKNSQSTFVGSKVNIFADAKETGDGGKVIVWGDDSTRFYGSLSAKGGSETGNGGFAEISGKNSLIAKGEVDLSAPNGEFGTLLYDPLNIQIVGGTADGSDQGNAVTTQLQNNPGSNTLGTINFADEGAGTPDPFIIFESEIEGTNANIILQARNGITTSGTFGGSEVLIQNNRNLTMQTRNLGGDGTSGIDLTGSTNGNSLLFRTQGTGTITLQTNTGGASTASITTGRLQTANGAINLQSNGGDISLNGTTNSGTGALTLNSNGGAIIQSGAITAGSLTVSSAVGNATLTNTANNITTLLASSTGGNISYREADGQSFALGASTLSGGGDLTLQVGGAGAITQTGAVTADVLNITTGSGNATLGTAGNNINNLVANSTSGIISYTEGINNSFDLSISNLGTGNLTLTTSGTGSITQSGASSGNILTLNTATGNATFNTVNNDFNTFSGTSTSTGTIAYRDDNGFAVGANNRGTANLSLQSATGNITQSGAITANILNVQTTSGNATLTNGANNISTLTANTSGGNVSYTEALNNSFILGASSLGSGNLDLNISGLNATITQTGVASGNTLTVNSSSTGNATLNTFNNDFNTLAGSSSSGGNLAYRDDNGFDIATNNRGASNLILQSATGDITQSGSITAGSLNVSSTSGNMTLTNSANNITTLLANSTGGNILYREADGQSFALGSSTLSGGGDLTLQVGGAGAITQSGAVVTDILNITTASGNATLGTAGNNINNLVANSTSGTISYTEGSNQSFILDSSNVGTGNLNLTIQGSGLLTQSGPSSGNVLTVNTTSSTGGATLNSFSNNFNTFSGTSSSTGTIAFRNDNGFDVGLNNRGTASLTLQSSTGNITQSGAITANFLNVLADSGNATLTNTGNNISNLVAISTSGTIEYTEANNQSFILSASSLGTGNLILNAQGTGSILQFGSSSGNTLIANTAGGNATFNAAGNDFDVFAGTSIGSGTIFYQDFDGFDLGNNNRGSSTFNLTSSNGNITQSGAITAGTLSISAGASDAILTDPGNNITTLVALSSGGDISYREADGQSFTLGTSTLSGGGDLTLQVGGTGSINQTGPVIADILNIDLGSSGNSILSTGGNNINTLNTTSTGANLTYTEGTNNSFNLNTANLTGGGDLSLAVGGTGTLTTLSPIVADILFVTTGTNATTISDATIDTFRANSAGGLVTFNAAPNQSFNLGTSAMTGFGDLTLNLSGTGAVTQTGALTGVQFLEVNLGTSGNSALTNTGNNIQFLTANGNGANLSYTQALNASFTLQSSNLGTGNLDLTVLGNGGIAQTGSLTADTLNLFSGSGSIVFTNTGNDINTITGTSTSGSISFTDANGFSVNASNVGSGSLTLTGGNTIGANIDVLGLVSGNNISIATRNDGDINLGANINAVGTTALSTQTTGNIITGSNTINSNVLNITTVSGHASQDGTSGGVAINTNVNNFAGNTTSGTIRINDLDNLNMNTSAVATGALFASNSAGNITIDDNVTATTGQLNFNAFDDLIIDKLSTNLSVTTGTTGSMNLISGRDILIGSNTTSGNLNVDGGFQTVNAGRDLTITGRGVAGSGGYSRLQGIGSGGNAQDITTGRDLTIQMSTNTTGNNNFGTIATTSTTGNQLINVGGELKVLGGTDNNSVSTSSARLSSTGGQNITVTGNITVEGGSGNNNTAIISAASTQNISSTNGSINVLGGSGTNSPGRITTTANSAALPSTISATTGGINIGTDGGILATANGGTLTLNGGTGGITINGNAQGGVGNQAGSLTLNVSGGANITQTGGVVNGGRINIFTDIGNATLTNADFTSMAATSNGGSVNYSDTDGLTLANIDLGGGDLTAIAFAPLLTATNAFAEANMSLTGNITNINNAILTANGTANITQSAGSLVANNLTININSGDAVLNLANNNVINLTSSIGAAGGSIQYTDSNDMNISTVSGFANLTSGNTFGVTTNGSITGVNLLGPITTGGGNLSFLADNDNNGSGSISIGGDLNSSGGNISLKGAGLLLPFDVASGSGTINLTSTAGNNINQGLGGYISGTTLNVNIGSGTANLTSTTNDVTNFSATSTLSGTVNFVDANTFNVNASNMGTGNLSLTSAGGGIGAGDINQSSSIIANRLDLQVGSGTASLLNGGNDINILGGNAADGFIRINDGSGGFATDNISVGSGALFIRSNGGPGLTQVIGSAITGDTLFVELFGGSQAVITNAGNDFDNVAFASQASTASYFDANGFNLLSADMDSNNFGAVGNLSLSSNSGNITQSGAIKTDNLTITTNSGNVLLTDNANDLNDLTVNSTSGNVALIDSDGLTINTSNFGSGNLSITSDVTGFSTNRSAGSVPPPINGIGTQLIDGAILNNEFGINLAGNISGTGNLILTVSDPNNANGINQLGGSISGNGLTLSTTGGNISINDADFISLSGSTNTGNLTYSDRDGVNLNNLNTGTDNLTISTFTPLVNANNTFTENNTIISGPLNANNITLDILNGDLLLGNSSLQAVSTIDIQVDGGNILGNTNINFPTLVAPLIQVYASGFVGTVNAPIGLGITGLLSGSFVNDAGRLGLIDYSVLTSLDQDISNSFYLFPSAFLLPQTPIDSGNITTSPSISTNPLIYSVLTFEDTQANCIVKCIQSINNLGWVCKKTDYEEAYRNLALKTVYQFGNKLSY